MHSLNFSNVKKYFLNPNLYSKSFFWLKREKIISPSSRQKHFLNSTNEILWGSEIFPWHPHKDPTIIKKDFHDLHFHFIDVYWNNLTDFVFKYSLHSLSTALQWVLNNFQSLWGFILRTLNWQERMTNYKYFRIISVSNGLENADGSFPMIINNSRYRPACAAKWRAEFPSLSGLLTSMPGRCKKSSRKLVRFVEQMYDRAVWKRRKKFVVIKIFLILSN